MKKYLGDDPGSFFMPFLSGETVEKPKKKELNASGSFKGLSEDDHRKIYRQKHW